MPFRSMVSLFMSASGMGSWSLSTWKTRYLKTGRQLLNETPYGIPRCSLGAGFNNTSKRCPQSIHYRVRRLPE